MKLQHLHCRYTMFSEPKTRACINVYFVGNCSQPLRESGWFVKRQKFLLISMERLLLNMSLTETGI